MSKLQITYFVFHFKYLSSESQEALWGLQAMRLKISNHVRKSLTAWCGVSCCSKMLCYWHRQRGLGCFAYQTESWKAPEWLKGPCQMIYSCCEFHSAPTWLVLQASPSIALFISPAKVFSVVIEMDCSPATTHKHIQSISNLLCYKNQCGVFTAATSPIRLWTPDGFDSWDVSKTLSHLYTA